MEKTVCDDKIFYKKRKRSLKIASFLDIFWDIFRVSFCGISVTDYFSIFTIYYDIKVFVILINHINAFWKPFSKLIIIYFLWSILDDEK